MFAKTIIDSDAFMEMPISARLLYYDLGMRADDDGFVNSPKKIMRMIGASTDDLNILAARKFIIPFDNGVVVIKHWRIHNYIRKDTYNETPYKEQRAMLELDENSAYRLNPNKLLPDVDEPSTERPRDVDTGKDRLGEDKLGKDITLSKESVCRTKDVRRIIEAWNSLGLQQIQKITADSSRGKMLKARVAEYGVDEVLRAIEKVRSSDFLRGSKDFLITFEWFVKPNNFPKVLEGNYDNRGTKKAQETNNSFLRSMMRGADDEEE